MSITTLEIKKTTTNLTSIPNQPIEQNELKITSQNTNTITMPVIIYTQPQFSIFVIRILIN